MRLRIHDAIATLLVAAVAVAWRRWSGGHLTMVEQVLGWLSLAPTTPGTPLTPTRG